MAEDIKSQISETMKKVLLAGVGTIFLTEGTIRSFLNDVKLPKEMWAGFLENANKTKHEFLKVLAKEVTSVLSKVDLGKEFNQFLEGHQIKLNIDLHFDKLDKKSKTE